MVYAAIGREVHNSGLWYLRLSMFAETAELFDGGPLVAKLTKCF
jgi:hypothetical protein